MEALGDKMEQALEAYPKLRQAGENRHHDGGDDQAIFHCRRAAPIGEDMAQDAEGLGRFHDVFDIIGE